MKLENKDVCYFTLSQLIQEGYLEFKKNHPETKGKKLQKAYEKIVETIFIEYQIGEKFNFSDYRQFMGEITKFRNKLKKGGISNKIESTPEEKINHPLPHLYLGAYQREKAFQKEFQLLGRDNLGDPINESQP